MKEAKDFLENLNIRFKSPLIFSFIISWIFTNWRIPIALIFYDNNQLIHEGYLSYGQLIESNLDFSHGCLIPLLVAVLYTFIFPYISSFIKKYQAEIDKKTEDDTLEIMKKSNVPFEKYHQIVKSQLERENTLSEFIKKENEINAELNQFKALTNDLNTQLHEKNKLISEQNSKITNLNEDNDMRNQLLEELQDRYAGLNSLYKTIDDISVFFKGKWICEFQIQKELGNANNGFERNIEEFQILNKNTYQTSNFKNFRITNIQILNNSFLTFEKNLFDQKELYSYIKLIKINDSLWFGIELSYKFEISVVRYYDKKSIPDNFIYFSENRISNNEIQRLERTIEIENFQRMLSNIK